MASGPLPNLKQLRNGRDPVVSFERLSEMTGISVSQLSRYENGTSPKEKKERVPTLPELKRLAEIFQVTISQLVDDRSLSSKGVYTPKLNDEDDIQVKVGVLRFLVTEAMLQEGLSQNEASAYAVGVIGSLEARLSETAVVHLVHAHSTPELGVPKVGDPS